MNKETKVFEIVLTGGPCSGKTTALAHITETLTEKGFHVFIVPEAATMLMEGGMKFSKLSAEELLRAQYENAFLITQMGASMRRMAESLPGTSIVLYDRGVMDGSAFFHKKGFNEILSKLGINLWQARDRFDGVLHLTSCAVDAPQFYTLQNNKARSETVEQAALVDQKLKEVWVGTQHHRVIDNSTLFEQKINRVVNEVFHIIGEPQPLEIEKKFLLGSLPDWGINQLQSKKTLRLVQYYLQSREQGVEERVRMREADDYRVYFHTRKTDLPDGSRIEQETLISEKQFNQYLEQRSQNHREVDKKRHCFLYENQYFELDEFVSHPGLFICEVELTNLHDKVVMPDFLDVVKEVTDEPGYKNSNIAKM